MPDGQNLPLPSPHPIAIIGGGLAGLAAACTLGARGHKVVLFEKNDWLGGKAAVFEQDGYPLRHGADHPDGAARAGPDLCRSRPAHLPICSICGGSIRNGAASSRTAPCSTSSRMWPR